MPKVLISDILDNLANEVFKNNNIEVDTIIDLEPHDLKNIIHKYDGLVVRSATKVTAEIISSGKNLKIIGRAGAGVDNIDLVTAKRNNIIVMNTPGGNTNATAEHSLSLLMSLYRCIPDANLGTHNGLWEKKRFKGLEIKGKNIGIIGFGNVGKRFASISMALGMKVSVCSESFESCKADYPNIINLQLDDLISQSDIISFHCNPPKNGIPILSLNQFKKMKKDAVIINTARGSLIDEKDLKEALENDFIRGAALDVFSEEPAKDNILFGTKNLILTPHIAASTIEAQLVVAKQIALQISNYFNNNEIVNSL